MPYLDDETIFDDLGSLTDNQFRRAFRLVLRDYQSGASLLRGRSLEIEDAVLRMFLELARRVKVGP